MSDLSSDLSSLKIERAPERRSSRWVGWLILVILLATGGYFGWLWITREQPVEFEMATVTDARPGRKRPSSPASGYVTARRQATVSSKITGKVIEVNVEEGRRVQEGQVLARLGRRRRQGRARARRRRRRNRPGRRCRKTMCIWRRRRPRSIARRAFSRPASARRLTSIKPSSTWIPPTRASNCCTSK